MLMLLFWISNERWAIASAGIKDVLPLVNLQKIPYSNPKIAGLLNYHGERVPTVDISEMMTGKAAQAVMNTRIVVVEVASERLGLIVERAEEMAQLKEANERLGTGIYCQATMKDDRGIVQQLSLQAVFEQAGFEQSGFEQSGFEQSGLEQNQIPLSQQAPPLTSAERG